MHPHMYIHTYLAPLFLVLPVLTLSFVWCVCVYGCMYSVYVRKYLLWMASSEESGLWMACVSSATACHLCACNCVPVCVLLESEQGRS
jgi:hypothetical protein